METLEENDRTVKAHTYLLISRLPLDLYIDFADFQIGWVILTIRKVVTFMENMQASVVSVILSVEAASDRHSHPTKNSGLGPASLAEDGPKVH